VVNTQEARIAAAAPKARPVVSVSPCLRERKALSYFFMIAIPDE
jgi:hypothetical protein